MGERKLEENILSPISGYFANKEALLAELTIMSQGIDALEKQVEQCETANNSQVETMLHTANDQAVVLTMTIERDKAATEALRASAIEREAHIEALDIQAAGISEEIDAIAAATKELDERVARRADQVHQAEEKLNARKHAAQEEAALLAAELDKVRVVAEECKEKIAAEQHTIAAIESEAAELAQETHQLRGRHDVLDEQVQGAAAALTEAEQQIASQRDLAAALQKQLAAVTAEAESVRALQRTSSAHSFKEKAEALAADLDKAQHADQEVQIEMQALEREV